MTSTKLASLAVVLSSIALLFGFLNAPAAMRATEGGLHVASQDPEQKAAMEDLIQRMTLLERRIEELQLMSAQGPISQRRPASDSPTGDPALLSRLQAVEKFLQGIKATQGSALSGDGRLDSVQSRDAMTAALLAEQQAKSAKLKDMVTNWTANALDPSKSESARLDALRGLRGNHLTDGTDARVPVVSEMIHMAQSSNSGATRANVWRQMDGVTDPALMSALMHALANDVYPDAREEAAESLGAFLPNSTVESALRSAMEFDEDKGVRDQAEKSLSKL